MLALKEEVLRSIARHDPVDQTLECLCISAERLLDNGTLAIVAVDAAGMLRWEAGPAFPDEYAKALDGVLIGPHTGACGSAIYRDRIVAATDIENDPDWHPYRALVLPLGFRSCTSFPLHRNDGKPFGALAAYLREARSLTQDEYSVAEECTRLCEMALPSHLDGPDWARVDIVTGFPGVVAFDDAFSQLSCDLPGSWGVLIIEVNDLKQINETLGTSSVDFLLRRVARTIASEIAPDMLFRLSGSRFSAIIQHEATLQDFDAAMQRALDAAMRPIEHRDAPYSLQFTMGGATLSPRERRPVSVLRNAEFALYRARAEGPGTFVRHRPSSGSQTLQRRDAVLEIKHALQEDRVDTHYQPIVRLDSYEVVGFEALCRMTGPSGQILPATFFQEAFDDAQIGHQITDRMLQLVAGDIRSWLDMALPVQHVGVNFTFADFYLENAVSRIERTFGKYAVPCSHLVVEVTEQAYIGQRDDVVARGIQELRRKGVRVALDDFGTGFAALAHLMNIPVDIIKIDQSFTRKLTPSHPSVAIVRGILQIANDLGIKVVTEGIETIEQIGFVREMGCVLGQGYAFSRPVNRHDAVRLLEGHGQHVPDAKPLSPLGPRRQ